MASLKYWVWLSTLRGVSNQIKLALLEHFVEPDAVYYADSAEYLQVEGMTRAAAETLEEKSLDITEKILGDCDRLGLRLLTMRDAEYPDRLRNIYDPPLLLYLQGRLPRMDEEVAIAMVGTRHPSNYALEVGEKLAFQLTRQGAVIVSGLAAGGDASAHRGALRAGGPTVAVIANGHDYIYPAENEYLYADIAVQGAILSEYPPGTQPAGRNFPIRNRIISGLCLGIVVTEAPAHSGTLITANLALEQGRDVFAVPGQIDDPHCIGSNHLLRDGAGVVTEAWDILSHYAERYPTKIRLRSGAMPLHYGQSASEPAKKAKAEKAEKEIQETARILRLEGNADLTDDQICILQYLQEGAAHVDDIIDHTQIPARRVLSALTMLEIDSIVTQSSGKHFALAVTLV